jgi:hypothetical protein
MGGAAHYTVCFTNPPYELGRKVFPDDLEKAIDPWSIDDAEIKPWGQYGGDGPQYLLKDNRYSMLMTFGLR